VSAKPEAKTAAAAASKSAKSSPAPTKPTTATPSEAPEFDVSGAAGWDPDSAPHKK
jgi:hypothetical protein